MSPLRDVPIRQKLLVITTVTVGLSLLLAGVVFYIWDYRAYRRYVLQDVGTTTALVAENLAPAVAFRDAKAASEALASLRAKQYVTAACAYDAEGRVLAAYSVPAVQRPCPDIPAANALFDDGGDLLAFRPIVLDGKPVGTVYLRRSFADIDRLLAIQSALLVGILGVALAVGLLLSNRLHRFVSVPLVRLAETAREVTTHRDYSLRATRYGGDELGVLVDAFNQMLAHIQQRTLELQNTQEKLQRTVGELQEAHRLKDEFLATLSHELRTPLNAMLGWARMLRVDRQMDPGKRERAIESIERNALAQARIVDDLLDISRIVSGKLKLELGPVPFGTVVTAAADVVRPAAEARRVRLTLHLDRVRDDVVIGDASRLQQMVWNLLSNAVKFTPAGGEVRVELTRGEQLELRVIDTGRGIDPGFLPHAFDIFRQADASSTREFSGLGLGLAIAQRIAELHGGSIALHSEGANRGTTAIVRLPTAPLAGRFA